MRQEPQSQNTSPPPGHASSSGTPEREQEIESRRPVVLGRDENSFLSLQDIMGDCVENLASKAGGDDVAGWL